ncbi:Endoplasmin [Bulinus truncatus]|nr:Endoplasmin [Bulinus truncatus]
MERIMKSQAYAKQGDASNQVEADTEDETAKDLAKVLFDTATLRSGFSVKDSLEFAQRIERMMKMSMGLDINAPIEEEPEEEEAPAAAADVDEEEITADEDKPSDSDASYKGQAYWRKLNQKIQPEMSCNTCSVIVARCCLCHLITHHLNLWLFSLLTLCFTLILLMLFIFYKHLKCLFYCGFLSVVKALYLILY